ncbi:50S ribosomal protein L32 [Dehalobacter sp. DCM]|uniref:50S ribosomal protein L32 n=1 Tax=Dehalobacter sp. DCM TaxID=2907827 RepID=UPI00308128B7|nr:50S ribosomal protein L32 [Dehalobacter sp. DCM]
MGVHQNKQSKSRVRRRRAMDKLTAPNLVECPQCHKQKLQHHICANCGYYNGKEVVSMGE